METWDVLLRDLCEDRAGGLRATHVERIPARGAVTSDWPCWVGSGLRDRLHKRGVAQLWEHQAVAADLAHRGENVAVATGTASGKSLAFLLPALAAAEDGGTTLYLAPTKALAADQARACAALAAPGFHAATYDGDTPAAQRRWIRRHADYVLTNPDMLHRGVLPRHRAWAGFLRRLRYVVVDESHRYRGVFGSHMALILRRLRRVCSRYGGEPVFVLASATAADPGAGAQSLVGAPVQVVARDGSPRGALHVALIEPEESEERGGGGAPLRRSATAAAADLLAGLVARGVQTLAFVRSRQGAESVALAAQRALQEEQGAAAARRIAAYRAGYLPAERRRLEQELHDGSVMGMAATNALELGVDIEGMDAVIIAGWPGTRASLWQQAGRAGRAGRDALAVFVARDDPLDTYLVHHPEAVFGRALETAVLDPDNPHILEPHLGAAAEEEPLRLDDLPLFGANAEAALERLGEQGVVRRRAHGWFWVGPGPAADRADLRGGGGGTVQIVESSTGQLLGTVDAEAAHGAVHPGAVHLHQAEPYLVEALDLAAGVALVRQEDPLYTTWARDVTGIRVLAERHRRALGARAVAHFGEVEVRRQVVGYLKRDALTGAMLGEEALELPERVLRSKAVWWTLAPEAVDGLREADAELAGAAHAAEHAAIGLLPLFATCDRWDIGGVSTTAHPDTGTLTVFVYDGQPGGAGFAERGYGAAEDWVAATRGAIAACACGRGCPSCVQSPKCGSGNEPLSKTGAVRLLSALLA